MQSLNARTLLCHVIDHPVILIKSTSFPGIKIDSSFFAFVTIKMKRRSWAKGGKKDEEQLVSTFKILTSSLSEHRETQRRMYVLYVIDRFNLKWYRRIHLFFYFILPTARDKPISKHAKSEVSSNEESMFRAFEGQNV